MLQAVELPARVSDLDTGLAYVDTDDFSHRSRLGQARKPNDGGEKTKTNSRTGKTDEAKQTARDLAPAGEGQTETEREASKETEGAEHTLRKRK
jgi:hypothetical protein